VNIYYLSVLCDR